MEKKSPDLKKIEQKQKRSSELSHVGIVLDFKINVPILHFPKNINSFVNLHY